jgi:peroxiredoxin
MRNRFLLMLSLAIPLYAHCQSYADSPFYKKASGVPSTAHVEGWSHGSIKANGIVIDLSESVPSSSPDFDEIRGWSVKSWVDRNKPSHIFHFYIQYDPLNVIFGYDLRVESVQGTDEIKCTFSALTDPEELSEMAWPRNRGIPVVALSADLTPVVVKSGGVIAITTLPLGEGRIPVSHYLRLTRTDSTPDSAQLEDSDTSGTSGDPRTYLLEKVEQHFKNANSFDVKGTASAAIPGSSWRATYEFETQGAQPAFLPLSVRGPSMHEISNVGGLTETQISPDATDPKPQRGLGLVPLGQYADITRRLIDAQKIGTESIAFEGREHSCEVIDAVYDISPAFKPHSKTAHKHFSIDSSDMLVLRETQSSSEGIDWTADVTSISFDQPPSESMVQALQRFANQPKDRPDWVGRAIPDLKLSQLSGSSVSLGELRGKPILLDFWGSYCAPCRRTTLHAQELAKQYLSSGLTVLTFTQDTPQDAKLWTNHYHVSLPVLLDRDGAAFKAFDVQGVPVAILVDADGKVIHYWVGLDDPTSMDSVLNAMLQTHQ